MSNVWSSGKGIKAWPSASSRTTLEDYPSSRVPTGSAEVSLATTQQVSFLIIPVSFPSLPHRGWSGEQPNKTLACKLTFYQVCQGTDPRHILSQDARKASFYQSHFTDEKIRQATSPKLVSGKALVLNPCIQPQNLWSFLSNICLQWITEIERRLKILRTDK